MLNMPQQTASVSSFPDRGNQPRGQRQSADYFLNINVQRRGGEKPASLAGIPLKLSKVREAQIIQFLTEAEDIDAALAQLKERLVLTFNPAGQNVAADLDLG